VWYRYVVTDVSEGPAASSSVPYGCETWSLTLREEHLLRVFQNLVLRRIFRQKRDEVTQG
jgi:hypothetical protein